MSQACEFPDTNPPDEAIVDLLKSARTIAVVGLSDKPERDSYQVAKYLIDHGYEVIPVNPTKTEILGRRSYPDVISLPVVPDIVDIFRKPDAIPGIVDEAIDKGARSVWMQLGLAHNRSAQKAREAGLQVVMSKCIKVEHQRIMQG